MYPNVRAEMARKKVTLAILGEELNLSTTTISLKLNGKYSISLDEAKKIKKVLETDLPLEILFEEAS